MVVGPLLPLGGLNHQTRRGEPRRVTWARPGPCRVTPAQDRRKARDQGHPLAPGTLQRGTQVPTPLGRDAPAVGPPPLRPDCWTPQLVLVAPGPQHSRHPPSSPRTLGVSLTLIRGPGGPRRGGCSSRSSFTTRANPRGSSLRSGSDAVAPTAGATRQGHGTAQATRSPARRAGQRRYPNPQGPAPQSSAPAPSQSLRRLWSKAAAPRGRQLRVGFVEAARLRRPF
ncbi:hypothetical protein NDU88_006274 [Pleurodeles waltl]|uniref:Uncharacterized protein n=1 Tax=Pleurodeles waltl TaxID=8319 RepID=A0AAV7RRM3_PLEWA|nr:hypothetical protein NDU88_006274 [Pleurodeles waltl]